MSPALAQEWLYTVRPGDNIWLISEFYLRDTSFWRALQKLNAIADPLHLLPGEKLRIPVAWLKIQPVPVRIIATAGDVSALRAPQNDPRPVSTDDLLYAGDEIRTGADGSITVEFADGSRLFLASNSRLVFDLLSAFGQSGMVDSRMRLEYGRNQSTVRPVLDAGSRYETWTPAGISAVRGTEFRTSVAEGGRRMNTEVLRGTVELSAHGSTVKLATGFGARTEQGQQPGRAVRLLPPPKLVDIPAVEERVPIRLQVEPVDGAAAYRLEIAPTAAFTSLLFDRVYPTAVFGGIDLDDGAAVLRVRAIDALGLEGYTSTHDLVVDARPEPPLLMLPQQEGMIFDGKPVFQWTEPDGAVSYHFQLAASDDFAEPLLDNAALTTAGYVPPQTLAPGTYFWRVAVTDRSTEKGPFSDVQRFRVPPPGPVAEPPESDGDKLLFRWPEGAPGERYRFQVATNRAFDAPIVDVVVDEPRAEMPLPDYGTYYLRVLTLDDQGGVLRQGAVQEINLSPPWYWLLFIPAGAVMFALLL
ncbi:MAG: FecR domain-containing protein [Rhodospirillales bacterium]|nr:FecR domain-containing protein [Rhodospirillales bacterium]